MSRTEIIQFARTHQKALSFVSELLTETGLKKAPIGAVLVKASYTCSQNHGDMERLKQFIKILQMSTAEMATTGAIAPEDTAALVLREFNMKSTGKNSGTFRKELYRKTNTALIRFINRQPTQKLYATNEEVFRLPG